MTQSTANDLGDRGPNLSGTATEELGNSSNATWNELSGLEREFVTASEHALRDKQETGASRVDARDGVDAAQRGSWILLSLPTTIRFLRAERAIVLASEAFSAQWAATAAPVEAKQALADIAAASVACQVIVKVRRAIRCGVVLSCTSTTTEEAPNAASMVTVTWFSFGAAFGATLTPAIDVSEASLEPSLD